MKLNFWLERAVVGKWEMEAISECGKTIGCQVVNGKNLFLPKPEGCMVHKAQDLLHSEKEGWNEELLREIFCEEEVQTILSIPVSSMGVRDRLI